MKIAYYMPFKPLGHPNPSGDLIIGTELYSYLQENGVDVKLISRFRCRWVFLKPYMWPLLLFALLKAVYICKKDKPDIWLTYHSYYKAPDMLGPLCCRLLNIPYVIFQGIYSTKRRRSLVSLPGFYLNRHALLQATLIITNKKTDQKNLERLLPQERILYIPPGLHPDEFGFDADARQKIRQNFARHASVVVMTAAMFRPGVKSDGIKHVIDSCSILVQKGLNLILLIAGSGADKDMLQRYGEEILGEKVVFLGKIERHWMQEYYSAADIFAFPGVQESLGMVYLEAQSCKLPVVAFSDWGASEAVIDGVTGYLSLAADRALFTANMQELLEDTEQRKNMGRAAAEHVRRSHDVDQNYAVLLKHLKKVGSHS